MRRATDHPACLARRFTAPAGWLPAAAAACVLWAAPAPAPAQPAPPPPNTTGETPPPPVATEPAPRFWLAPLSDDARQSLERRLGYRVAAEFAPDAVWFNTRGLSFEELRGKVIVVQPFNHERAGRAAAAIIDRLDLHRPEPSPRPDARPNAGEPRAGVAAVLLRLDAPRGRHTEDTEQLVERFGINTPAVVEPNTGTAQLLGMLEPGANLVIDREGVIRYAGLNARGLREAVARLSAEPAPNTPSPAPVVTELTRFQRAAADLANYLAYARRTDDHTLLEQTLRRGFDLSPMDAAEYAIGLTGERTLELRAVGTQVLLDRAPAAALVGALNDRRVDAFTRRVLLARLALAIDEVQADEALSENLNAALVSLAGSRDDAELAAALRFGALLAERARRRGEEPDTAIALAGVPRGFTPPPMEPRLPADADDLRQRAAYALLTAIADRPPRHTRAVQQLVARIRGRLDPALSEGDEPSLEDPSGETFFVSMHRGDAFLVLPAAFVRLPDDESKIGPDGSRVPLDVAIVRPDFADAMAVGRRAASPVTGGVPVTPITLSVLVDAEDVRRATGDPGGGLLIEGGEAYYRHVPRAAFDEDQIRAGLSILPLGLMDGLYFAYTRHALTEAYARTPGWLADALARRLLREHIEGEPAAKPALGEGDSLTLALLEQGVFTALSRGAVRDDEADRAAGLALAYLLGDAVAAKDVKLHLLLAAFEAGYNADRALRTVYGQSTRELDRELRRWLRGGEMD